MKAPFFIYDKKETTTEFSKQSPRRSPRQRRVKRSTGSGDEECQTYMIIVEHLNIRLECCEGAKMQQYKHIIAFLLLRSTLSQSCHTEHTVACKIQQRCSGACAWSMRSSSTIPLLSAYYFQLNVN